ncbi:MAG: hypothetical protein ACXIUB_11885 [Wenzhouxiangella sp.]
MKRNTLTTAVLAGLTGMAGMVSVSNAVNVNPDGLGQVLLYPYYTARGGNDTYISIVNTTDRGKAVKIRFIEALNSREVLDFNIYMSPFDVWTAAITATDEGGAKMITRDTTCTVPYFVGMSDDGVGEQAFLDFEFTGEKADGGPTGIERTASGYIEVIEMGTFIEQPDNSSGANVVPWSAKHVTGGQPRNCQWFVDAWTRNLDGGGQFFEDGEGPEFGFDTEIGASGGLFGAASIINVQEGTMFSYNATAIDGFWTVGTTSHTNPDSLLPSLASINNNTSFVFNNGQLATHTWAPGVELFGLNATLAFDRLMNEYVTEAGIGARTEWVLTFPTKRFHTDVQTFELTPNEPIPPFTRTWNVSGDSVAQACEDLSFRFWDREEAPYPTTPDDPTPIPPIVSPRPPVIDPEIPEPDLFQLCREANVIRFGADDNVAATEILGEPVREGQRQLGYTNFALPFDAGWVRFDLAQVPSDSPVFDDVQRRQSLPAQNGDVVEGLPVIGFGVSTFTNGTLSGGSVLSNYGGTFNHRGSRSIVAD